MGSGARCYRASLPRRIGSAFDGSDALRRPGATASVLATIACDAPNACVAAGSYRSNSPTEHAYSALFDGESWTLVEVPAGGL